MSVLLEGISHVPEHGKIPQASAKSIRQPLRHGDYVENSEPCLLPAAAQGAGAASVFAFPRSCHSSLTFGTFVAVGFLNAGSDRHPEELGDITSVG